MTISKGIEGLFKSADAVFLGISERLSFCHFVPFRVHMEGHSAEQRDKNATRAAKNRTGIFPQTFILPAQGTRHGFYR